MIRIIRIPKLWFAASPNLPQKVSYLKKKTNQELGEPSKEKYFLGNLSQIWVGGVSDSQTRFLPLKKKNHPETPPFLTRISPFVFPNLTKTLGWVHRFGKTFIKNAFFRPSLIQGLSRDFSGRDFPLFSILGFKEFFRDLYFGFICLLNRIIFINFMIIIIITTTIVAYIITIHWDHYWPPFSVTLWYSCVRYKFSRNIQTNSDVFIPQTSAGHSQSPNIHSGSWKGHQKSPESPLFRLDPFFLMSCTLQILILERSEFVRGGLRCGGEFYDCVKRGLNGGSRVVRPSKSFIQSPTLWGRGKFSRGLKDMQFAVTNTAIVFTRIKFFYILLQNISNWWKVRNV